ncbi:MAG: ABC transporter permease [Chloroflexi bacterium]|nr:ABC transporter permease [Chloroflexota bacterium]
MIDSRMRWNARLAVGGFLLALVFFAAAFAPLLTPYSPNTQDLEARRTPPSPKHPFGLDEVGRDNLSRVLFGARLSLGIGIAAVTLALVIGTGLGLAAGYRGGWLDSVTMSMLDVMLAFPTLLLAIVVITALGRGLPNVVYALAFAAIPNYARLARVGVLAIKEKEYVLAAEAVGVSSIRLIWHHILPNCLVPLQVQATVGIGTIILEAAGLSFLGLGAQPPTPEWGLMIAQGRGAVFAAPHIVLFPGIALMLTVLAFNFIADGLQDLGVR